MNYIKLMNNVWDLREQGLITQHECDLYCYLVHRSNKLDWQNPFAQSSEVLCAVLGIGRNALSQRRNKLRRIGLINFKEGTTKTKPAEYEICPLVKAPRNVKQKEPQRKAVIKDLKKESRKRASVKKDFAKQGKSISNVRF